MGQPLGGFAEPEIVDDRPTTSNPGSGGLNKPGGPGTGGNPRTGSPQGRSSGSNLGRITSGGVSGPAGNNFGRSPGTYFNFGAGSSINGVGNGRRPGGTTARAPTSGSNRSAPTSSVTQRNPGGNSSAHGVRNGGASGPSNNSLGTTRRTPQGNGHVVPNGSASSPLGEAITERAVEAVQDKLEDELSKLIPGLGVATSATGFIRDVVMRQQRILGENTLANDPGSRLIMEEGSLAGNLVTAQEYAFVKGYTTWQDNNRVWYFSKNPEYTPTTPFTQLMAPGRGIQRGPQAVDEAAARRTRSAAADRALREEVRERITDFFGDKAADELDKLLPGSRHAIDAHGVLTDAVNRQREEMSRGRQAKEK